MQRLARLTYQDSHTEAVALLSQYDHLKTILLKYLPPSTAALFAHPIEKNGYVEWWTDLEGQPFLLVEQHDNQTQIKQINRLIDEQLSAVEKLAEQLQRTQAGTATEVELLQRLVKAAKHDTKQIYLVNNSPVIIGWGMGKVPEPITPTVIPPVSQQQPTNKRWLWLLGLLLLLALLAYWWFGWRQTKPVSPVLPAEPVVLQVKEDPVKKEEPVKEEPIKEEPIKEVPPQEEIKPEPIEEVKPEKVCRQTVIPGETPQMVIIFNNAAAMQYTIKETPQALAKFDDRWGEGKVTQKQIDYMFRKPNRSSATKTAMIDLLKSIDSNIDIGLIELRSCLTENDKNSAKSYGIFSKEQRGKLEKQIQNLKLRANKIGGIPIHEGLQRALKLVDGKERDAFILFITDGNGECTKNGDACQLLKQEIQLRPKLKVNIVQINAIWNHMNCLAETSGGQIFNSLVSSEQQLKELIGEATKPMQTQEVCE